MLHCKMSPHTARVRRSLRTLLLCVLLMQAVLTPRPGHASSIAPPSLLATDPRFGVVEAWRASTQATAIGVRWERIGFWWKALQPYGPNSWNPFATGRDHYIARELAAGRHLVGLLINTPDWAALHPIEHGASVPAGLYLPYNDPHNYWGHFIGLMVKRYAGRIDDWILWNEVNIPNGPWHTWDGTVGDYAQLVKVAYLAAKAVNPHALIVLYGDPYWYDYGAFFNQLLKILTAYPEAAANHDFFDAANLHLYSRPKDLVSIFALYRRTMARYGLHKQLWLSETNAIPYNDPVRLYPRANFFASLDDQASYIVDTFALALALGVDRIEVNRMIDGTDFVAGGEPIGLLRNDRSLRPAYYAYRTVSSLYSHVTGGTIDVNPATGVYMVTLHKPGATVTVVWDQRPIPTRITIPATSSTATLYDKFSHAQILHAVSHHFTLSLARATGNTDSADPTDYVIGGNPQILVQSVNS